MGNMGTPKCHVVQEIAGLITGRLMETDGEIPLRKRPLISRVALGKLLYKGVSNPKSSIFIYF